MVNDPLAEGQAQAQAMLNRRVRLGLDTATVKQQEVTEYDDRPWVAIRWTVQWRWKTTGRWAFIGSPGLGRDPDTSTNPWTDHPAYIHCTTEAIARNAVSMMRRRFPGKMWRFRPSNWRPPLKTTGF